jgi:hypothetical protein
MSDDDTSTDTTDAGADGGADEVDPQTRIAQLERQNAMERISFETGVPADLLAQAESEDDMLRIATDALLWQASSVPPVPPPPPTAAVPADWVSGGTGVIVATDRMLSQYIGPQTVDALKSMSPTEILSAWRSGHLARIGVGPPQRNGTSPMLRRR